MVEEVLGRAGGRSAMSLLLSALAFSSLAPGQLFAVGGGTTPKAVAEAFIKAVGKEQPILVMAHTRQDPAEGGKSSAEFLRENGASAVEVYGIEKPSDQEKRELEAKLKAVRGIWIPGGQQGRFIERFGADWSRRVFGEAYRRGVHFFGTSAGAMLMSDVMIYGPGEAQDTSKIGPGLGLTSWIIDTHFKERRREARLEHALKESKRENGLGLSESEWVVIVGDVIKERHAPKAQAAGDRKL